ncbi:MAG: hypothetical protein ACREB3_15980, partial [Burkholderiales bacterium]
LQPFHDLFDTASPTATGQSTNALLVGNQRFARHPPLDLAASPYVEAEAKKLTFRGFGNCAFALVDRKL